MYQLISKKQKGVKMKFVTHNDKKINIGGHLQGYVDANYNVLVKLFGKPSDWFDDYKSDAEWIVEFEDGKSCTIYNYKDGKNYCGDEDGLEVWEIRGWHIGGEDKVVVDRIQQIVKVEQEKFDKEIKEKRKEVLVDLKARLKNNSTVATDFARTLHNNDVELMQTLDFYTLTLEKIDKITKEIDVIENSTIESFAKGGA
tara:strand:+ start:2654 stop:3250 length:597 start_codon:yes stop_codon:yes gene_type:complete